MRAPHHLPRIFMKKAQIIVHQERCKGCRYCLAACKKGALRVATSTNAKGYRPVEADPEKCVACGSCFTVCPDYVFELLDSDEGGIAA